MHFFWFFGAKQAFLRGFCGEVEERTRLAQVQRTLESPEKTDDNGQQETKTDAAFWCGERRWLVWVAGWRRLVAVRLSGGRDDPWATYKIRPIRLIGLIGRELFGVARDALGCGERRITIYLTPLLPGGSPEGEPRPPLVPQQRRGITRLFFAYFLFPLKRK